jgi:hypothetical protein
MAITNQKYLQISFALDDGDHNLDFLTLPIKPEELTRTEPSRTSVVNSMDGAWIDAFGRGLTTLTISGNTGWGGNNRPDGVKQFSVLRDQFIHRWHDLRKARIDAGQNPDDVRLIFIDPLNSNYVADVVPGQFVLRRNKNQPLLLLYNITMTVTNDKATPPQSVKDDSYVFVNQAAAISQSASLKSIAGSLSTLQKMQGSLGGALASIGEFGKTVHEATASTFGPAVSLANDVIKTANDTRSVISASGQVAINLATDLSAVAVKMWSAVAAVTTLPNAVQSEVMQVKGAFSNLFCVLRNGYGDAVDSLMTYDDLYGASNCSSTAGGRPASAFVGSNSFETSASRAALVGISPAAAAATKSTLALDITKTINATDMASNAAAISSGVTFNA